MGVVSVIESIYSWQDNVNYDMALIMIAEFDTRVELVCFNHNQKGRFCMGFEMI